MLHRTSMAGFTIVAVLVLLVFSGSTVLAQDQAPTTRPAQAPSELDRDAALHAYVDAARAELKRGKADVINEVMQFTADEAATFWPIYAEYEQEMFDLGDKRIELMRRFVAAQGAGGLDKSAATEIANGWFDFERSRLDLYRKYYDRIERELSPVQAIRFVQIEHRFASVVDLMLASEMPIASGPSVTAAAGTASPASGAP